MNDLRFYYDLYDGESEKTDGQANEPESQSFNIDEYFDTVDTADTAKNNNLKDKQEKHIFVKPSMSDRSTKFPKPKQNHFNSVAAAARPTSSPAFNQAAAGGAPDVTDRRDPTFVLSRLLFHLAQLPQQ